MTLARRSARSLALPALRVCLLLAACLRAVPSAGAQAVCEAGAPHAIPLLQERGRETMTLALAGDHGLAVARASIDALDVVPFGADGSPGARVRVPMPHTTALFPPLVVGTRFVLRAIGVCAEPNPYFHKCVAMRVVDANGAPVGAPFVEDVAEWTGGDAIVIGTRIVMVRAPMYDRDGTPTVTSFAVRDDGSIVRSSGPSDLGGPLPAAEVFLASDGARYHALLYSSVEGRGIRADEGSTPFPVVGLGALASRIASVAMNGDRLRLYVPGARLTARVYEVGTTRPARIDAVAAAEAAPRWASMPAEVTLRGGRVRFVARAHASELRIDVTLARAVAAATDGARTAILLRRGGRSPGHELRVVTCR